MLADLDFDVELIRLSPPEVGLSLVRSPFDHFGTITIPQAIWEGINFGRQHDV
jgi:hypothetical protein